MCCGPGRAGPKFFQTTGGLGRAEHKIGGPGRAEILGPPAISILAGDSLKIILKIGSRKEERRKVNIEIGIYIVTIKEGKNRGICLLPCSF